MKIALIVTGGLHPSGREQVVPAWLWLLERLAMAHEVHAFALRHLAEPATYSLAGATVHDLGRPKGIWAQWSELQRALRSCGRFDVLHGYFAHPAGMLAAIAGRALKTPTLVSCDSGEFVALADIGYGSQLRPSGRAAVAIACRLATRVHVTTRFMSDQARARGVDTVRIPVGVDIDRVPRRQPPADGPPWRLLQVASLNPVKDQSTLLKALRIAREEMDVRLDLVGEDTLDGALQRQAAELGLVDAVAFHGWLPHDALAPFHDAAHLYVQSSRHEGDGIAVLEACAAGVPVLGTAVGYVSDLAPQGATAVPTNDARALAWAVVRLLQEPAERSATAAAARAFVLSHDADWTSRKLVELYRSLDNHASAHDDSDSEHTQR